MRRTQRTDTSRRRDRTPAALTDDMGWYDRYHQLQNRHDQLREVGASLPPVEEAERRRLHARLLGEASVSPDAQPDRRFREVPYAPGLEPPAPGLPNEVVYSPGLEPPSHPG